MENGADSEIDRVKRLLCESSELVERISALTDERAKLDPLPGSLRKRHLQCGKRRCRCKTGTLHGPYYYFEPSRQHGKWRYVSRDRLADVKKGIADWRKQQEIDETLQTHAARLEAVLKAIQQEIASVVSAP
ncbi:MAG: DUF6788 family protein [Halobacteriota archaeon]